jgi:hypothetical protein
MKELRRAALACLGGAMQAFDTAGLKACATTILTGPEPRAQSQEPNFFQAFHTAREKKMAVNRVRSYRV